MGRREFLNKEMAVSSLFSNRLTLCSGLGINIGAGIDAGKQI